MLAASAFESSGSTATTRASGFTPFTAVAIPETSPPPPTWTRITSASGTSSSISSPTVPWPAITSGSSYGCTSVRPVSSISRSSRSKAAGMSGAESSTVAPYARAAAIFIGDAVCHMTTSASIPSSADAYASACAWLPAEIEMTPRSFSSCVRDANSLTVRLHQWNRSGVGGTMVVTPVRDGVAFVLKLQLPTRLKRSVLLAHVNRTTCAGYARLRTEQERGKTLEFPLAYVVKGSTRGTLPAKLKRLRDGNHSVEVGLAGGTKYGVVACGDFPRR